MQKYKQPQYHSLQASLKALRKRAKMGAGLVSGSFGLLVFFLTEGSLTEKAWGAFWAVAITGFSYYVIGIGTRHVYAYLKHDYLLAGDDEKKKTPAELKIYMCVCASLLVVMLTMVVSTTLLAPAIGNWTPLLVFGGYFISLVWD